MSRVHPIPSQSPSLRPGRPGPDAPPQLPATAPEPPTRITELVVWVAAVAASATMLHASRRVLPHPPTSWHPAAVLHWAEQTDPTGVALLLGHGVAVALVGYLVLVVGGAGLARLCRSVHLARVVLTLTVPALRPGLARLAGNALGVATLGITAPAFTSAVLATPAPAVAETLASTDHGASPPVLHGLGPAATGARDDAPPVLAQADAPATTSPAAPSRTDGDAPAATGAAPDARPPDLATSATTRPSGTGTDAITTAAVTWTIAPGEHLWFVAAESLTRHRGAPPSVAETAAYLQLVIEANRHNLAVPDNPDLVFPGQVFTLPAPPS